MKDLYKELVQIIGKYTSVEIENIKPENNFFNDLGYTSISIVNLILVLENRYKITFSDEYLDFGRLNTVQVLYDCVKGLVDKK